jgi:hypothetical protein
MNMREGLHRGGNQQKTEGFRAMTATPALAAVVELTICSHHIRLSGGVLDGNGILFQLPVTSHQPTQYIDWIVQ